MRTRGCSFVDESGMPALMLKIAALGPGCLVPCSH